MKIRRMPEPVVPPMPAPSPSVQVGDSLTVNAPDGWLAGVVAEKLQDGSITVDWG